MKKSIRAFLKSNIKKILVFLFILFSPLSLLAAGTQVPSLGPVRIEFIIFALILAGVAVFNKQTFWVAVIGLSVLLVFKFAFDPGFHMIKHLFGTTPFGQQIMDKSLRQGEWGIFLNLAGLLFGFAILKNI